MFVACVHVHVKEENREQFIEATLENARNSVREPGNLRFDVNQQTDDPSSTEKTLEQAQSPADLGNE